MEVDMIKEQYHKSVEHCSVGTQTDDSVSNASDPLTTQQCIGNLPEDKSEPPNVKLVDVAKNKLSEKYHTSVHLNRKQAYKSEGNGFGIGAYLWIYYMYNFITYLTGTFVAYKKEENGPPQGMLFVSNHLSFSFIILLTDFQKTHEVKTPQNEIHAET